MTDRLAQRGAGEGGVREKTRHTRGLEGEGIGCAYNSPAAAICTYDGGAAVLSVREIRMRDCGYPMAL